MAGPAELGLGALEVLSKPGTGRAVGVYSKAAYLMLPGGLVALTTFEVPSGPIHARVSEPLTGLRVDDRVVVTRNHVQAGPILVDLAGATTWRGSLPDRSALVANRELAMGLLKEAPPSSLDKGLAEWAAQSVLDGDLTGCAAALGGVGQGLTPAGDDCLAGILLIASIFRGEAAVSQLLAAAAGVETNTIAKAFLLWAARGQSIEPAHDFLISAARGDRDAAKLSLERLCRFGHSSGADLALGLRIGLAQEQVSQEVA